MKKIGVLLSGCGCYDGSEIHEAVLTLLSLSKAGVESICIAPDIDMTHVIDHSTGAEASETRNVFVEASRIGRGKVVKLSETNVNDFDALILPGGFGAAKNFSDYAFTGKDCKVRPDVSKIILKTIAANKPLGAICIAPVIVAKVLGKGIEVTIGTDNDTASNIESFGAKHIKCSALECHVDEKMKVVTTSAYMNGESIAEIAEGIDKLVKKVIDLI